jgi:hypothetical protein
MSMLNFMTAIYWGQLSKCTVSLNYFQGYSCSNRTAYGAVSAFSVLIFLTQIAICGAIILWRNELIVDETGLYDELSNGNSSQPHLAGGSYEQMKGNPFPVPSVQTSADL